MIIQQKLKSTAHYHHFFITKYIITTQESPFVTYNTILYLKQKNYINLPIFLCFCIQITYGPYQMSLLNINEVSYQSRLIFILQIAPIMEEMEELQNQQRRDLGQNQDLELMIDHDDEHEERELKNKIIFNMQGLGAVRTVKRNQKVFDAYIKGPHCEESVRDLVRLISHDSPVNPKSRFILADYNIVESDLLQLLVLQVQDKKLSFWIIALLQLLTQRVSDELNAEEKQKLMGNLCEYKNSFVKHECFQILMVHIADFYKTPQAERLRAHYQMMEFTIKLIRNLVQIPNNEKYKNLHNHFLAAFIKEDMFNPLLYIIQTDRSPLMDKIDIPLMEIFYHTFTCFKPNLLYSSQESSVLKNVMAYRLNQRPVPTRHSRFLPMFQVTSEAGIQRLVHKIEAQTDKPFQNQKKVPVRMAQNKKVMKIQSDKLDDNFMKMEIENEGSMKTIGEVIIQISRQFLEVEFQQVVKLVFDSVFRETSKVAEHNLIQYLLLCSWALQVTRAKYKKERSEAANDVERDRVEFSFGWVVQVMQTPHFELIYKILSREANRDKKKQFKVNFFHAGLKLFNSYLDVVSDISNSMNMSERKNANVLMANMFRHDIAKILRIGFHLINHDGILSLLIKTTHKFFKLLSVYSDGKVLTIQTNRLLKKRKKKTKEEYYNEEEEMVHLNISDSEQQKQGEKVSAREEERYQQRKYNEKSQFAIIAEYSIITKYMSFLKNDKFLQNAEQLNEGIFYYLQQIKKLLNGQWLFFQAETLCVFQKMLSNHQWAKSNKDKVKFLQLVCTSFIKLLRKNPLVLTESLFRFSSLSLKDHIMKNYSDEYEYTGQQEENMFTDQ